MEIIDHVHPIDLWSVFTSRRDPRWVPEDQQWLIKTQGKFQNFVELELQGLSEAPPVEIRHRAEVRALWPKAT